MQEITSWEQLEQLFTTDSSCIVYKFNPNNCRLSDKTRPLVEKRLEQHKKEGRWIDVINHKDLSIACAEHTNITHASPQAISIHKGHGVAHASHMHISMERLDSHCI